MSAALGQRTPAFPVMRFDSYAVSTPIAMAEGDLNGDGVTDTLYAAASSPAGSTVLTSAPRSASGANLSTIAAGSLACTANSMLLADLNKDNKLDAIITCNENAVAVLAGNGDGTFQAASTYAATSAVKAVAVDLNADGYPDLAVATNTGSSTSVLAVLLNNASGVSLSFATPRIYTGGSGGIIFISGGNQLGVCDWNNDGKADIVAGGNEAVSAGLSAMVFYGKGDGTLQISGAVADYVGSNFSLADFDGDGHIDAARAVANLAPVIDSVITTFPGKANQFMISSVVPGMVKTQAVDVNGDGHPDVVLTGDVTTILLNDGTGSLKVGRSYATPGTFYVARKGTAGMDLIFATPRGFYTLHGDGTGTFDGIPAFATADQISTGDINGDGLTDFVALDPIRKANCEVIGLGNGSFVNLASSLYGQSSVPLLADFDADGVADLAQIYQSRDLVGQRLHLLWTKGSADGKLSGPGAELVLDVRGNATGAAAGDFDHDGRLDIVFSDLDNSVLPNVSRLFLVRGNGDGTFVPPAGPFSSSVSSAKPLLADLDNDGKLDLVWDAAYRNNGTVTPSAIPLPVSGTPLAVGDLNGDHIPDVVIDNAIYSGNGDGSFQLSPFATIAIPAGATLISASIGDLDGDGNADLVIQHMTDLGGFTIVYGDGTGNLTIDPNPYTTGTKTPVTAGFARLNNQATGHTDRPDYLVAEGGAVVSLLNQNNPTPGSPLLLPTQLNLSASEMKPAPSQTVSLYAQVTGHLPSGSVTLKAADGSVLGTVALTTQNYISLPYSFPGVGAYTISASYSGDDLNAPSVSAPVTLEVQKKQPAILVDLAPSTVFYTGHTVTFRAFLSNNYNPTNLLTFSSGDTILGASAISADQAHLDYRFPAPGSYSLTASYPGDAANEPAISPVYNFTVVDGPDFSITANPSTNTVNVGGTATYNITVTSLRDYSGYVMFTCQPACPASEIYVAPGLPKTVKFSITLNQSSPNTGPNLTYGPIGAAFLLLGIRRKNFRRLASWQRLGLFTVLLACSMLSLSGCSSSKDSGTSSASSGNTYNLAITGTDSMYGFNHTVNLTLIVK
jgi:hypothetical protein